jgi:uncharacterized protein YcbK (DUF882 family)
MSKVQMIRDMVDMPMSPSSGWRCEKHNREVGGEDKSTHCKGHGIDVKTDNSLRALIMEAARSLGITRFGIGNGYLHLDDGDLMDSKVWPPHRVWDYYPKART